MAHRRQESSDLEPPRRPARLGAFLAIALGVFGACTTEDPREYFRFPSRGALDGSGGRSTATAGASNLGGSGSTLGSASASGRGNDTAGKAGTGGKGGTDSTHAAGEGGDDGNSAGRSTSQAGSTGSGAAAGSGAGPAGGTSGTGGEFNDECGERPVSTEAFSKQALRAAAADCAVWHYCKFEAGAARLEQAAAAHVAAPTPETLAAARARWTDAMAAWSAVELFQFGPLSSRAESEGKDTVHGQGLREFVYSWPRFTRCRVEEQLASERYATIGFPNVPLASRGLFALEYVLFYEGDDTACDATSSTATTWAGLDSAELDARKQRYLTAVSADVLGTTHQLLELWSPNGGNFRQTFIDAQGYMSEQQALTILAWALIYIEREVKDWKLGLPLGITATHPVSSPEAPFAHTGTDNIRQNLRGFRALFQGCGPAGEGLGFDDWLTEAGHPELGQDIIGAIDSAEAFASTFPPLHTATPEQLEAFYRAIKALTDYLKSDLFGDGSPLNLDLPGGVVGDTD